MAIEKQATMTAESMHASSSGVDDPALINADGEKDDQRHLALLVEHRTLEHRLRALQESFEQAYKETSLMKMKSILTVGNIKLEIDSLQEDRLFLIQKYHNLKRKLEDYRNDCNDKNDLLDALKAERRERRRAI